MRYLRVACLSLACAAGCGSTEAAPERSPSVEPVEAGDTSDTPELAGDEGAPAETACAALDREGCLHSTECTLDAFLPPTQEPYRYVCRPARGECERDFAQIAFLESTPREELCESRGCRFEDARCYCRCRGYGSTAVPDGEMAPECDCDMESCAAGEASQFMICRAR